MLNGATTGEMEPEPLWAPVTMIAPEFFDVDFSTDTEPLSFDVEAYLKRLNQFSKQLERDLQATLQEEFNALRANLNQIFDDDAVLDTAVITPAVIAPAVSASQACSNILGKYQSRDTSLKNKIQTVIGHVEGDSATSPELEIACKLDEKGTATGATYKVLEELVTAVGDAGSTPGGAPPQGMHTVLNVAELTDERNSDDEWENNPTVTHKFTILAALRQVDESIGFVPATQPDSDSNGINTQSIDSIFLDYDNRLSEALLDDPIITNGDSSTVSSMADCCECSAPCRVSVGECALASFKLNVPTSIPDKTEFHYNNDNSIVIAVGHQVPYSSNGLIGETVPHNTAAAQDNHQYNNLTILAVPGITLHDGGTCFFHDGTPTNTHATSPVAVTGAAQSGNFALKDRLIGVGSRSGVDVGKGIQATASPVPSGVIIGTMASAKASSELERTLAQSDMKINNRDEDVAVVGDGTKDNFPPKYHHNGASSIRIMQWLFVIAMIAMVAPGCTPDIPIQTTTARFSTSSDNVFAGDKFFGLSPTTSIPDVQENARVVFGNNDLTYLHIGTPGFQFTPRILNATSMAVFEHIPILIDRMDSNDGLELAGVVSEVRPSYVLISQCKVAYRARCQS